MSKTWRLIVSRGAALSLLLLLCAQPGYGQLPLSPEQTSTTQPVPEPDPFGRDTPRGLVDGLLSALSAADFERAARFLDLSLLPAGQVAWRGSLLAGQLQRLLDRQGQFLSFGELSSVITGNQNDGLDPGVDSIGTIETNDGPIQITATRVAVDGASIWQISADIVSKLPALESRSRESTVDRLLPSGLKNSQFFGVPAGHWLVLFGLALVFCATVILPASLLVRVLDRSPETFRSKRSVMFIRAAALPAASLLTIILVMFVAAIVGVSIVARGYAGRLAEVLAWTTLAWLLWRFVNGVSGLAIHRMVQKERSAGLSVVTLFRRASKTIIVIIALIAGLNTLGLDMTTGIAALGIGGLALALGAQKTIENFVGSLTLVADQPIRVGDFCRFGETLGTVEDIGMRSTRIRTLERTLVTIPNGDFASMQIENYTVRDRFLLKHLLGLRYDTQPSQMAEVLAGLQKMLESDPRIATDPLRVRFTEFGPDALVLEVFAYVYARDWDVFLETKEQINLRIMEIVSRAGADFAFPTRTIYFGDQLSVIKTSESADK